ncbi:hypothetical protein ACWD4N_47320 [Streptomyces sp. NPDC002586]
MAEPEEFDEEFSAQLDEELAGELEREFGDDRDIEDDSEGTNTAKVRPATPWPQFNISRAHAELRAIEMLMRGASYLRVRHATRLSPKEVRRLATIVAEEAANPASPRIVCRTPTRGQAARIKVRRPADSDQAANSTAPAEPDEPVQMTLSLDC